MVTLFHRDSASSPIKPSLLNAKLEIPYLKVSRLCHACLFWKSGRHEAQRRAQTWGLVGARFANFKSSIRVLNLQFQYMFAAILATHLLRNYWLGVFAFRRRKAYTHSSPVLAVALALPSPHFLLTLTPSPREYAV